MIIKEEADRDESYAERLLRVQGNLLDSLAITVTNLEERFRLALRPAIPEKGSSSEVQQVLASSSPLCDRLEGSNSEIERVIGHLNRLIDRSTV